MTWYIYFVSSPAYSFPVPYLDTFFYFGFPDWRAQHCVSNVPRLANNTCNSAIYNLSTWMLHHALFHVTCSAVNTPKKCNLTLIENKSGPVFPYSILGNFFDCHFPDWSPQNCVSNLSRLANNAQSSSIYNFSVGIPRHEPIYPPFISILSPRLVVSPLHCTCVLYQVYPALSLFHT